MAVDALGATSLIRDPRDGAPEATNMNRRAQPTRLGGGLSSAARRLS